MELSEIRENLDAVDDELVDLFLRRMELVRKVGEFKAEHGIPVLDRSRERDILATVRERSGDMERFTNTLYQTLFQLSRSYQNTLLARPSQTSALIAGALARDEGEVFPQTGTVACQGVEGGNSQMACDRLFPRGNLMYFKTFEAVFDAVASGLCRFGVLPIENSSSGSVREVYDLFQRKQAYIVRSVRLFISHELVAKPGTGLEDIKVICSHEQALRQCSAFIEGLPAGIEVRACGNTAEAARLAAESDDGSVAAIASHDCGELYGLATGRRGIQNSENNYTRFVCIAAEPLVYPGANRISLVLSCKHEPGALYEVMGRFNALGINLLKLESCPIVGQDFEFMFFFDLEASVHDPDVMAMLGELERTCQSFTFLGNYLEA